MNNARQDEQDGKRMDKINQEFGILTFRLHPVDPKKILSILLFLA